MTPDQLTTLQPGTVVYNPTNWYVERWHYFGPVPGAPIYNFQRVKMGMILPRIVSLDLVQVATFLTDYQDALRITERHLSTQLQRIRGELTSLPQAEPGGVSSGLQQGV